MQPQRKGEEKALFYGGMPYLGVRDTPPHRPSPGLLEGRWGEFCFISTFKTCSSMSLCTYIIQCRGKTGYCSFQLSRLILNARSKEAPEYCRSIAITSLFENTIRTNPTNRLLASSVNHE